MASQHDDGKAMDVGARIARARNEAGGMTQEELAALIKVSLRSIQAYEAGDVLPYKQMPELERVLGRPVAWFLYGEEALKARDEQFAELKDLVIGLGADLAGLAIAVGEIGRGLNGSGGPDPSEHDDVSSVADAGGWAAFAAHLECAKAELHRAAELIDSERDWTPGGGSAWTIALHAIDAIWEAEIPRDFDGGTRTAQVGARVTGDLDQLREVFGADGDLVYRGMRELYGEMSLSEALETVLRVMDKTRAGRPLDEREARVLEAMSTDQSHDAVLAHDIRTGLGFFAAGTPVETVGALTDGTVLVRAGIGSTTFPVPRTSLVSVDGSERAATTPETTEGTDDGAKELLEYLLRYDPTPQDALLYQALTYKEPGLLRRAFDEWWWNWSAGAKAATFLAVFAFGYWVWREPNWKGVLAGLATAAFWLVVLIRRSNSDD